MAQEPLEKSKLIDAIYDERILTNPNHVLKSLTFKELDGMQFVPVD